MSDITQRLVSAWDEPDPDESQTPPPPAESQAVEESSEETTPPPPDEEEEEVGGEEDEAEPQGETAAVEDAEEDEEGEEGAAGDEDEEQREPAFVTDDPDVKAFLAKYQGDPERALKNAAQLQRVISRQGQDKAALQRQVTELQAQLAQAQVMQPFKPFLNEEQREWVEHAVGSENPAAWVQQAVTAGEWGLARALCDEWAQNDPYQAMRTLQAVEQAEYQASVQTVEPEAQPLNHGALMDILVENFPEMPNYEQQMVATLSALGDSHPLAVDARSQDPETAARGIIGLYEIARASTASVNGAREEIKTQRKAAAKQVRRSAAVSSAQQAPNPG
ncbi:MAG TPA: hypothetical protein VFG86_05940, partial [Chloroflexota bacterium]|nr:hypothetical protein [Chloroflexota bacterium]